MDLNSFVVRSEVALRRRLRQLKAQYLTVWEKFWMESGGGQGGGFSEFCPGNLVVQYAHLLNKDGGLFELSPSFSAASASSQSCPTWSASSLSPSLVILPHSSSDSNFNYNNGKEGGRSRDGGGTVAMEVDEEKRMSPYEKMLVDLGNKLLNTTPFRGGGSAVGGMVGGGGGGGGVGGGEAGQGGSLQEQVSENKKDMKRKRERESALAAFEVEDRVIKLSIDIEKMPIGAARQAMEKRLETYIKMLD